MDGFPKGHHDWYADADHLGARSCRGCWTDITRLGEADAPAVSGGAPPVLVTTKLTPPQIRDHQMVLRAGLLERLDSGADAGLTLLACPAGFGKTSLLASWYAAQAGRIPMGWLTLDKGDNDPVVLWSYLLEALRMGCPTIGESVPRTALKLRRRHPDGDAAGSANVFALDQAEAHIDPRRLP